MVSFFLLVEFLLTPHSFLIPFFLLVDDSTINVTVLYCKCGGDSWKSQITKWGHFKDSKWPRHKIETFRGARDIFGPLNGHKRQRGAILEPKK